MRRIAFIETPTCRNRSHCATCRDPGPEGERWRLVLSRVFPLPDDNANFTCPFGVEWGMGAAVQVTPPAGVVIIREADGCCGS
jgi:hypothetical protein